MFIKCLLQFYDIFRIFIRELKDTALIYLIQILVFFFLLLFLLYDYLLLLALALGHLLNYLNFLFLRNRFNKTINIALKSYRND